MFSRRSLPRNRAPRTGVAAIEILLLLPVLVILVMAFIQFALHLRATQKVEHAVSVAVRVAARGGDEGQVTAALSSVLGNVIVEKSIIHVASCDSDMSTDSHLIEVKIRVPANLLVPDLLSVIGAGLNGKLLEGRAIAARE